MTDQELIDYYAALMILQYKGKPNALAMVKAFVKQAIANQIIGQVIDAFDINKAKGVQLDMIAEIKGASRMQVGLDLTRKYFAAPSVSDPSTAYKGFAFVAGAVPTWFFRTVADDFNPTYSLTDDELRRLILYLAQTQASNHSLSEIDRICFQFFGTHVTVTENAMALVYHHDATNDPDTLFKIVNHSGALMHPAGVQVTVIET